MSLLSPSSPMDAGPSPSSTPAATNGRYSRLPTSDGRRAAPHGDETDDHKAAGDNLTRQQRQLVREQDEVLEDMSASVGNLRQVSSAIGGELDEQAVMLDEFGAEIENAETKLDATMRKMAKVLHMSNGEQLKCGSFTLWFQ